MSGLRFVASFDLDVPIAAIGALADLDRAELLDGLGALGASQTQRRIEVEKTDPDGVAWSPNAEGTSTLFHEGNLGASIDHVVDGQAEVAWGSSLIYAAIHQHGGVITAKNAKALVFSIGGATVQVRSVTVPRRAYLGISAENAAELEAAALRFIGSVIE